MNRLDSWIKVLSRWCVGLLSALAFGQAVATTGAVNTTDNPGFTEPLPSTYVAQACLNGGPHSSPSINCNIYDDKRDVWLSGLVSKSSMLGDGTYFFTVLVPGSQNDPNDGAQGNLSSTHDTYVARTFSVLNGVISYSGPHNFDSSNDIIQLAPYDDTTNPGGEYILAVCQYDPTNVASIPVDPSTCKYDAFKVLVSNGQNPTAAIVACKFDDGNGNGIYEPAETLLPGWKITAENVITDSNTIGEQTATTDGSGCVSFTIDDPATLQPGQTTVTLSETQKTGWIQTAPLLTSSYGCYTGSANGVATVTATFVPGTIICTVYFGNTNLEEDQAVTASKTAVPTEKYTWTLTKSVTAPTLVEQQSGTHTFYYTVTVSHDAGVWKLSGVITLTSTFIFDIPNVTVADDPGIKNQICSVSATSGYGGSPTTDSTTGNLTGLTIPAGAGTATGVDAVLLSYKCTFDPSSVDSSKTYTNTVHVLDSNSVDIATPGTQTYSFVNVITDDCVTVTDNFNNSLTSDTLGSACVGDGKTYPYSFPQYTRVVTVKPGCITYPNTATATTDDTGTTVQDSKSVEVCGPAATGALTMGFWQNKNGQGIITGGASTAGVCNSGKWLRTFLPGPYQDLSATATCSQVATYVYNVIKAATCSGPASAPCNAMLKAQDLATSLDVYFSDPGLGGNKINAPAPIGGVSIDLQMICKMIDASGGTATCSGTYEDVTSVFGNPTPVSPHPHACMKILDMLTYAASQASPGGVPWYGVDKSKQVLAKDAFDAINNSVAFACP